MSKRHDPTSGIIAGGGNAQDYPIRAPITGGGKYPTSGPKLATTTGGGGKTMKRRTKNGPYAGTLLGSLLLILTFFAPAVAHAFIM